LRKEAAARDDFQKKQRQKQTQKSGMFLVRKCNCETTHDRAGGQEEEEEEEEEREREREREREKERKNPSHKRFGIKKTMSMSKHKK